jgi:hypothetical protein
MKAYQERVFVEASELREKVVALREFMDGDLFCDISCRDQILLHNQEDLMSRYLNILRERTDNFKED